MLENKSKQIITDENGNYQLRRLPKDKIYNPETLAYAE